jgi:hypothetical protein
MLFINYCKKILTGFLFFISLFIISISCDSAEPPANILLTLKLEDVSCTEAWLQLKTANLQLLNNVTVFINDLKERTFNLTTTDTLFYIDSLLPNQNYSFQLISFYNPEDGIKSNKVNATTMDTTSHNFTWEFYEFGEHSSPSLYDVAIIDENNIWAVGEIAFDDSLGNTTTYNAIHWDGQNWELKKIGGIGGWACHTLFAFSETDIWFEGNIHWDGSNYTVHKNGWPLMPNGDGWQVNKMWGSISNDLYAVGNYGNIAHYNGSSWQKVNSGTLLPIQDIWGSTDPATGDEQVLCIASSIYQNEGKKLLKIESSIANALPDADLSWSLSSIWFKANRKYYIAGDGLYPSISLNNIWQRFIGLPLIYKYCIRGNDYNNIAVCGAFGLLSHFNGYSWQNYGGNELPSFSGKYVSVAVTGNTIIAIGYSQSRAVIAMGKR